jgi:hypothetical protein
MKQTVQADPVKIEFTAARLILGKLLTIQTYSRISILLPFGREASQFNEDITLNPQLTTYISSIIDQYGSQYQVLPKDTNLIL